MNYNDRAEEQQLRGSAGSVHPNQRVYEMNEEGLGCE